MELLTISLFTGNCKLLERKKTRQAKKTCHLEDFYTLFTGQIFDKFLLLNLRRSTKDLIHNVSVSFLVKNPSRCSPDSHSTCFGLPLVGHSEKPLQQPFSKRHLFLFPCTCPFSYRTHPYQQVWHNTTKKTTTEKRCQNYFEMLRKTSFNPVLGIRNFPHSYIVSREAA